MGFWKWFLNWKRQSYYKLKLKKKKKLSRQIREDFFLLQNHVWLFEHKIFISNLYILCRRSAWKWLSLVFQKLFLDLDTRMVGQAFWKENCWNYYRRRFCQFPLILLFNTYRYADSDFWL